MSRRPPLPPERQKPRVERAHRLRGQSSSPVRDRRSSGSSSNNSDGFIAVSKGASATPSRSSKTRSAESSPKLRRVMSMDQLALGHPSLQPRPRTDSAASLVALSMARGQPVRSSSSRVVVSSVARRPASPDPLRTTGSGSVSLPSSPLLRHRVKSPSVVLSHIWDAVSYPFKAEVEENEAQEAARRRPSRAVVVEAAGQRAVVDIGSDSDFDPALLTSTPSALRDAVALVDDGGRDIRRSSRRRRRKAVVRRDSDAVSSDDDDNDGDGDDDIVIAVAAAESVDGRDGAMTLRRHASEPTLSRPLTVSTSPIPSPESTSPSLAFSALPEFPCVSSEDVVAAATAAAAIDADLYPGSRRQVVTEPAPRPGIRISGVVWVMAGGAVLYALTYRLRQRVVGPNNTALSYLLTATGMHLARSEMFQPALSALQAALVWNRLWLGPHTKAVALMYERLAIVAKLAGNRPLTKFYAQRAAEVNFELLQRRTSSWLRAVFRPLMFLNHNH